MSRPLPAIEFERFLAQHAIAGASGLLPQTEHVEKHHPARVLAVFQN